MPDDDYNTYRLKYEPDWNQAGEEVGQGGFGVVFTHKIRRPGMLRHELCAVKRIPKTHMFPQELYEREISIFCKLIKHEWFLQFFAWHEDPIHLYIIMENIDLGDLGKYIDQPWADTDAVVVAEQLLQGLQVLHDQGITHRDLKPANIFPIIIDHNVLRIKLGDFGVSKRVGKNGTTALHTSVGTYIYSAPEVFSDQRIYSSAVDMWSLGCVLFRIVTGSELFVNLDEVMRFKYTQAEFPRKRIRGTGKAFVDFLAQLIQCDATKRPTSHAAVRHHWVTSMAPGYHISDVLRRRLVGQLVAESESQPMTSVQRTSISDRNNAPLPDGAAPVALPVKQNRRPPPPPLPRRSSRSVVQGLAPAPSEIRMDGEKPNGFAATLYPLSTEIPGCPDSLENPNSLIPGPQGHQKIPPSQPSRTPSDKSFADSFQELQINQKDTITDSVGEVTVTRWRRVLGEPIFFGSLITDSTVFNDDIPRLWRRENEFTVDGIYAKFLGVSTGTQKWVHLLVGDTAQIVIHKSYLCNEDQRWINQNARRCNPAPVKRTPRQAIRKWTDRTGRFEVDAQFVGFHPLKQNSQEVIRLESMLEQFGGWSDYILMGPLLEDVVARYKPTNIATTGGTIYLRKMNQVRVAVLAKHMCVDDLEHVQFILNNIHGRARMELPPETKPEQRDLIFGDGFLDGLHHEFTDREVPSKFEVRPTNMLAAVLEKLLPDPTVLPPPWKISKDEPPIAKTYKVIPDRVKGKIEDKENWKDKRSGTMIPPCILLYLETGNVRPEVILMRTSFPGTGDTISVDVGNLRRKDLQYVEKATNTNLEDYYDAKPEGSPYTTISYSRSRGS